MVAIDPDIAFLNYSSFSFDGNLTIDRNDVFDITFLSIGVVANTETTYGGKRYTMPIGEESGFTIVLYNSSESYRELRNMQSSDRKNPRTHTVTFFDGVATTLLFKRVIFAGTTPLSSKEESFKYSFDFKALAVEMNPT